jgi:hypothetical protein
MDVYGRPLGSGSPGTLADVGRGPRRIFLPETREPVRRRSRIVSVVIATIAIALGAMFASGSADAAGAPIFTLAKAQTFSSNPHSGFSTCQNRYVTLPKLDAGTVWSWSEIFGGIDQGGWVVKKRFAAGKYYWTVCVRQISNIYYNYEEYSVITLDNTACDNGDCTTYTSDFRRFQVDTTGSYQWGSQIYETAA